MEKGEKYIIEIEEVINSEIGPLARIKGFKSCIFDEVGLSKLEKVDNENSNNN